MGRMKELLLRQMEAGYSQGPGQKHACPACIADEFLRADVTAELESDAQCSYCGSAGAADLTAVLDSIADYLATEFADPAAELPYDGREGGYQGTVFSGDELVWEIGEWAHDERLVEDAARAFGGSYFCERDYFGLKADERLRFGWEGFVELVKHKTRYLFFDQDRDEGPNDPVPPHRLLGALGGLVERLGLYKECAAGTPIFRARVHGADVSPESPSELGPPPRDLAVYSNRMSPAGVPMFYGALDQRTAVLETLDPARSDGKWISIGTFEPARTLSLLDLTDLPPYPSPFDTENRHFRRPLSFLYDFVRDFTRPVARDGREHFEYVPTQVVTEYVRYRHRPEDFGSIDGIIYTSSRAGGGRALVLFLEGDQCGPTDEPVSWAPEEVLTLVDVEKIEAAAAGIGPR